MAMLKVKLRSNHDAAHLHPLTNVPTKSTSYSLQFPRYSLDKIHYGKVKGQIKVIMMLHTYNPLPVSLPTPYGF